MPYITTKYERTKLYEEVWTEAVTKVAKRYGVSDVALRKNCKKLGVPLPPLGYWAKVAAGKKISRPPLPKHTGPTELAIARHVDEKPTEPEAPEVSARRRFEDLAENRILVADVLERPEPLVAETRRAFNQSKFRDARGFRQLPREGLDISVSEASLDRALRIMDAMAKALKARGLALKKDVDGDRRTYVELHGQKLAVRLAESAKRSERQPTPQEQAEMKKTGRTYFLDRYSYTPTNRLRLGITYGRGSSIHPCVADRADQRIEDALNEFMVILEEEALRRKVAAKRHEAERRRWEEESRRRYEYEERQRKELERLKRLEDEVNNWRRAENIRAYANTVERQANLAGADLDSNSELTRWMAWARRKADWLDPLVETKTSILDDEQ